MSNYYFSVIIPTYKDDCRLNLCLKALVDQTIDCSDFEVIIVNNDPLNDVEIALDYFSLLNLKILSEKTPGSYAARNCGIQHAFSKILAFTDSDCIPDPNWLQNAKKYFLNDEMQNLGILTGEVHLFYKNRHRLTYAEIYDKYTGFDFKSYVKEGSCGAGNWFSYKFILEEFGGFRTELKSNGDTELSKRISKKYQIVLANDVIVMHPARYHVKDLVYKYRRLLGGTYFRKYRNRSVRFFGYLLKFTWRRFRFSFKKILTVPFKESFPIFIVALAINYGAFKEYFQLIFGGETKR